MLTNLHLGAKVTGFNDEHLGTVKYLVADPNNDLVTHLVVHEAGTGTRDILVESGRLNRISDDGGTVNLNLNHQQLAELPDFVEREYVNDEIANGPAVGAPARTNFGDNPVPVETDLFGTSNNSTYANTSTLDPINPTITNGAGLGLTGTANGLFGNAIGPVGAPVEERLNVSENSLIIREGASVEALDGHIGKVKEVNIDPDSGQITSFVVERGLFILDDYTVPVQVVESTNQDQVFVKLTRADFKNAPLAEEAEPANYAPTERVDETVEEDTGDTTTTPVKTAPVNDTSHPADRA